MAGPNVGDLILSRQATRRGFLALVALGAAVPLAQACAPAQSSPTSPAKPAPTAAPAAKAATTAPAAKATAAAPPAAKPTTAAPPKAKTLAKLSMSSVAPTFWQAVVFLGIAKGIYAEQGIDLSFQTFESSNTVAQALITGQMDAGSYNTAGQLTSIEKGAPIKIIGSVNPGMSFVIGTKKQFNKLEDLYGHSFGTSGPGTFPEVVMRALMEKEGLDSNKIDFVNIGGASALLQALLAGKIDSSQLGLEHLVLFTQNPDLDAKVLFYIGDRLPEFISGTIAVHNKVIAEQSDRVTALMIANLNAIRYARSHKQEVVDQEVKRLAMEERVAAAAYDEYVKRVWRPNLELSKDSIQYMQRLNVQLGQQEKVLPFEQVADWRFLDQALAKVGRVSG